MLRAVEVVVPIPSGRGGRDHLADVHGRPLPYFRSDWTLGKNRSLDWTKSENMSAEGNQVSKSWTFTLNNYTDDDVKFFNDIEVSYIVYGKEGKGEGETPHLQGFVTFTRAYRFTALKKLHKKCHWQKAVTKDAANYCMKDGDYTVRDNRKKKGARDDLKLAAEIIQQHSNKRQMLTDPRLFSVNARYSKWVEQQWDLKPKTKIDITKIKLRPWQMKLMEYIHTEPDDRRIRWYVDKKGGMGKSWMTNLLMRNHDAFLAGGKKNDVLYAYRDSLSKIIIFDLSRSLDGDHVPYGQMETLKGGVYMSPKYQSRNVLRDGNAHVIVFSNQEPDRDKLSEDRWEVITLVSPGQGVQEKAKKKNSMTGVIRINAF